MMTFRGRDTSCILCLRHGPRHAHDDGASLPAPRPTALQAASLTPRMSCNIGVSGALCPWDGCRLGTPAAAAHPKLQVHTQPSRPLHHLSAISRQCMGVDAPTAAGQRRLGQTETMEASAAFSTPPVQEIPLSTPPSSMSAWRTRRLGRTRRGSNNTQRRSRTLPRSMTTRASSGKHRT